MKHPEHWGIQEYARASVAALAAISTAALCGCGIGSPMTKSQPRVFASASSWPPEGCDELVAQQIKATPREGTTIALGLYGVWGPHVTGERFTIRRIHPNPHGLGSIDHLPIVKPDAHGILPPVFYDFPPTTKPEEFTIQGEVVTDNGDVIQGRRCDLPVLHVMPIKSPEGPDLPLVPAGTGN